MKASCNSQIEIFAVISESTASVLKCSASLFLQSKEHTPVKDARIKGTRVRSKKKKEVYLYFRAIYRFLLLCQGYRHHSREKMQHFFFPPVLLKMSHTNIRGFYSRKKKGLNRQQLTKKLASYFSYWFYNLCLGKDLLPFG